MVRWSLHLSEVGSHACRTAQCHTDVNLQAARSLLARSAGTAAARYGVTREIGWVNREIGPKTVRAHNKSCPAALWDGPACRCSNFFGGNFVAAPDIAQKPAAPPRSLFARYPALRTPAALRRRPRHARRRFRAAHLVVVTVYAHAPAPRRTRTKVAGRKTADGARNLGEKERALFNARDRFT